jgi:hypothetical protein
MDGRDRVEIKLVPKRKLSGSINGKAPKVGEWKGRGEADSWGPLVSETETRSQDVRQMKRERERGERLHAGFCSLVGRPVATGAEENGEERTRPAVETEGVGWRRPK